MMPVRARSVFWVSCGTINNMKLSWSRPGRGVYRLRGRSPAGRCDAEVYQQITGPRAPRWNWWVDHDEDESSAWGEGSTKNVAQAKQQAQAAFLRCLGPITEKDRERLVELDHLEEKKGLTKKQKAEVKLLHARMTRK